MVEMDTRRGYHQSVSKSELIDVLLFDHIKQETRSISQDELARMLREQEQRGVVMTCSGSSPPPKDEDAV